MYDEKKPNKKGLAEIEPEVNTFYDQERVPKIMAQLMTD